MLLTILFLFLLVHKSIAQAPNISYGEISIKDFETPYDNDTSAAAVILFNKGYFNGNSVQFTHHIRIKILKPSGTSWANWPIMVPTKGNISGVVFNLEGSQIRKDELPNSSIYYENIIKNIYQYKVFMPNVKVGSIIDIKYYFIGVPFEWRFQERIPTLYNELTMEESPYCSLNKAYFGLQSITAESPTKWSVKNVPAFVQEPYLNHYSNYISKFIFELTSFKGYVNWELLTSWQQITEHLITDAQFGGAMRSCSFLNDKADELKNANVSNREKIDLAYQYIKDNIHWNGVNSYVVTRSYVNNFKKDHTGNAAEINLTLIALLNKIGIKTYPVVLSTRDHGMILRNHPALEMLNYVAAYVNDDGLDLLLDATVSDLQPGLLPKTCLNGEGLMVYDGPETWVPLNKGNENISRQFLSVKIKSDGTVQSKLTRSRSKYGYLDWATTMAEDSTTEKYLHDIKTNNNEIEINKYTVTSQDKKKMTISEAFELDVTNSLIDLGDVLAFTPNILTNLKVNPFTSDERLYPVDLFHPVTMTHTVSLELPETLKVKSLVESAQFHTPDNSASFTVLASPSTMGAQVKFELKLNKAVFSELEYLELRNFYQLVIAKINEPIIISK